MSQSPFVLASECHIMGDLEHVSYYPGVKRWRESGAALAAYWMGDDPVRQAKKYSRPWSADSLIEDMDEAGIDMAFLLRESFMDVTGYATAISTNGYVFKQVQDYPDRLMLEMNVGPVVKRGVDHAIWELKYWAQEHNVKLCKVYPPEDVALDDPRMWPFYEAAQEIGMILTIHTGLGYVAPQSSYNGDPALLDKVCNDFPDLRIIAYHMGWPNTENLIGHAAKHKNLYMSVTGIIGWYTLSPYRGYHHIGQAIQVAGVDKIVFGLDWPAVDPKKCVDFMRNLQMPEELTEKWGFRQITDEDRAKMLGTTLAGLVGVETKKLV